MPSRVLPVVVAASMGALGSCGSDSESTSGSPEPGGVESIGLIGVDDLGSGWVEESSRELPSAVSSITPPCDAPPYDDSLAVELVREVQYSSTAARVGVSHTAATISSSADVLSTWRGLDCAAQQLDQRTLDLAGMSADSVAFELASPGGPVQVVIATERDSTFGALVVTGPGDEAVAWAATLSERLGL